jgi:hypothetical protein
MNATPRTPIGLCIAPMLSPGTGARCGGAAPAGCVGLAIGPMEYEAAGYRRLKARGTLQIQRPASKGWTPMERVCFNP